MTHLRPPITEFTDLRLDCPDSATLRNGIEMWVVGNGEEDICRLDVILPGGTVDEEHSMLASATAACTTHGNCDMTQQQIAETLDYYGSWKTSSALDHHTVHSLWSLNANFHKVLPVFDKCLLYPTFPQKMFEVTRTQMASNCALALERVSTLAGMEMLRLYYGPGHPMARKVLPDDVMGLSREMLTQFHKAHYHSGGCRVVLSGRVDDKIISAVEQTLGSWLSAPKPSAVVHPIKPLPEMLSIVDKPGAVQAAITMTLRTVPRKHKHYIRLRLLTMLFGGFFGSRLMTNIREQKGYTYGIGASLLGRADDAYIVIATECSTEHVWDVVREVRHEMCRLREERIEISELNTVKRHIMSDLAKTLDTPFKIAEYVKGTFLHGTYPEYFNDQVRETQEATPEELMMLAQTYLRDENLRVVVAADKAKLAKLPT